MKRGRRPQRRRRIRGPLPLTAPIRDRHAARQFARHSTSTHARFVTRKLGSIAAATASGSCMTRMRAAAAALHQLEIIARAVLEKAQQRRRAAQCRQALARAPSRSPRISMRLARHVEPDQDQRRGALGAESAEDDARRFGIVPDVELGRRRDIAALAKRAAHQDEALQLPRQVRDREQRRRRCWSAGRSRPARGAGVRARRREDRVDACGGAASAGGSGRTA